MSVPDDLPASPLATEISAKFDKLMARGGRIDRILTGNPGQPVPRVPDDEADRILTGLETQVREYREEMAAALDWHSAWKGRQPKGFRAKRRKPATDSEMSHVKQSEAAE